MKELLTSEDFSVSYISDKITRVVDVCLAVVDNYLVLSWSDVASENKDVVVAEPANEITEWLFILIKVNRNGT